MGGLIGRMLNEFAVTVALALGMSALVALFVTPALAALRRSCLAGAPSQRQQGSLSSYLRGHPTVRPQVSLSGRLRLHCHRRGHGVPRQVTAQRVFPTRGSGPSRRHHQAQQDVSFEAMASLQVKVEKALRRSPHVAHVVSQIGSAAGGGNLHQGRLIVELRPRQQRGDLDQMLEDLRLRTSEVPELSTRCFVPAKHARGASGTEPLSVDATIS